MAYVEDTDYGFNAILENVKGLDGSVKVGVLQGKGTESNGTNLVDVAVYNEYGTERIPSRPFMRLAADNHGEEWQDTAAKLVSVVITGGITKQQVLEIIGNKAKGDIQSVIGSSQLDANALSTVKRKGSAAPLIDTGRLRSSIDFRIEGGG